ncbi:MAG TPA: hypothetical protein VMK12_19245 [Anaeromyxobacteraceae bacterium]|nr:hypothetical protein [Anaeromyxobacteraceae bacterium]
MAVDRLGELRVAVPEHLLHDDERHTRAEQQRRRGVPEVVKADGPHHRLRPELHLALWATSLGLLLTLLDVSAPSPAAYVAPVPDDARPAERAAENAFQVHVPAKHRPAGPGEDERALRGSQCCFQPGHEIVGDRDGIGVPALGGLPLPAAADENRVGGEVHVLALEGEQLALAHRRVEASGVERPPARGEMTQHPRDLLGAEEVSGMPPRDRKPRHGSDRILPRPAADGDGGVEGAREEAAKVVDAPRTQPLPSLAVHERLDVDRSKRAEREPGQVRVEEVDAQADGIRSVGSQVCRVILEPPSEKLADRASTVVRCKRLEAIELAPRSKLEFLGECLRGPLRVGNRAALSPPAAGVLPPREPVAPFVADCRGHLSRSPSGSPEPSKRAP